MRKALHALVAVTIIAVVGSILMATTARSASSPSMPPMRVASAAAEEAAGAIIDSAPAQQQEQLADGGVSLDEYRDAVDQTRDCLHAALSAQGVPVEIAEPQLSSDRYEYSYSYRVGPKPDGGQLSPDLVSQLDRTCRAQFLEATEDVYQLRARADRAFNDSVRDQLARCLQEVGIEHRVDGDARDVAASAADTPDGAVPVGVADCLIDLPSVTDVVATEVDGSAGR